MRPVDSCAVLVGLACSTATAAAQNPATPGQAAGDPTLSATVQTLVRTIESQQQLLEEQGRQLEQLRREVAEMRALAPPAQGAVVRAAPEQTLAPLVAAVQGGGPMHFGDTNVAPSS